MAESERIADEVGRMVDGGAWHGPSLTANLTGVTAEQAAARPIASAHSIWEIVLHLTAWADEVAERLSRRARRLRGDDDWPPVTDTSLAAWNAATESLWHAHRRLRAAIRDFPPNRLSEIVGGEDDLRDASFYLMLHGLAQHDAYHAGQIALLRKALER